MTGGHTQSSFGKGKKLKDSHVCVCCMCVFMCVLACFVHVFHAAHPLLLCVRFA